MIDQEYPRSTTWESFHADQLGGALETEPRYVLLDHDYTTTDGRPADKIILISWIRGCFCLREPWSAGNGERWWSPVTSTAC